jgi:UDP-N-acetylmuramoyl-tripeptide--D-alanyl-D-alanine ligase
MVRSGTDRHGRPSPVMEMRERSLSEVAAVLCGRLRGGEVRVCGVAVDSREAKPGDLFFALAGSRTDGHAFVEEAFRHGASAAVVRTGAAVVRTGTTVTGPAIEVPDTGAALLALAATERRAMHVRVVGITGSAGKTITKDFARAALSTTFRIHASPRSFNNQVGLPLTILGAGPATDVLVCEIGGGVVGEIGSLCAVARPDVGIVTNVGLAHVETFGSPRRIRRAKAELVESLSPRGLAILNADDPAVRRFASRTVAGVVSFGRSRRSMVRADDVELLPNGCATFTLAANGTRVLVELPAPGEHLVMNALAAAACAMALGVPARTCAEAFRTAELSPWRMEVVARPDGVRVLNDAYNANPGSMAVALRAARAMAGPEGSAVAVLGPMAELGRWTRREHRRIGRLVAALGFERLVVVGSTGSAIADGARRAGMPPNRIAVCSGVDEAVAEATPTLRAGDVIVVKGSRVAGLERAVERLTTPAQTEPVTGGVAGRAASRSGAPWP